MVNFMIGRSRNIFGVFIGNELKLTQVKVIFVLVNHES